MEEMKNLFSLDYELRDLECLCLPHQRKKLFRKLVTSLGGSKILRSNYFIGGFHSLLNILPLNDMKNQVVWNKKKNMTAGITE